MKVKLISYLALTLGLVASSLAPAAAVTHNGNKVYKASVNNTTIVYIDAPAGSRAAVDLGNQPRTYTRVAGACGEVKLSPPKGNTSFTDLKVDGTAVDYTGLPTQTLPACASGKFAEARTANFKTPKGQVVLVGKTVGASVSIEVPAALTRTVGVNGCGFGVLRPQKGGTLPDSFKIDGTTYTLSTMDSVAEVPVCRKSATGAYSVYLPQGWVQ